MLFQRNPSGMLFVVLRHKKENDKVTNQGNDAIVGICKTACISSKPAPPYKGTPAGAFVALLMHAVLLK